MKLHLPKTLLTAVVAALVTPAASGATELKGENDDLVEGENVLVAKNVNLDNSQTLKEDVIILGYGWSDPLGHSLTLCDSSVAVTVDANLRIASMCRLNISDGSLSAKQFLLGHETVENYPAYLNMSGGELSVSTIAFQHQKDVNTISITGGTLTITGTEAITMAGSQTRPTQDYASTVFIGGEGEKFVTLKAGDTAVEFDYSKLTLGNVKIAAENENAHAITISNATLTGTIDNQAGDGKLILSGNIALALDSNVVTISDKSYYSDETTLSTSDNGYLHATYTATPGKNLTIAQGTVFTIDGNEKNKVTYNSDTGECTGTFTNLDTYYIHDAKGAVDYSKAKHLVVDLETENTSNLEEGNTYTFDTSVSTKLESMTIKSGKVISEYAGGGSGDGFMRGDVYIKAGAELQFTKDGDVLGWKDDTHTNYTKNIYLEGSLVEGETKKATLTFHGGSTTGSTNIYLQGYTQVIGGELNSYGGVINATGNSNMIKSKLQLRKALTVNVGDASQLTISGEIGKLTYNNETGSSYTATLTKIGTGSLSITGVINGDNIKTGTNGVTIDGGNSTTISSATIQYATIKNATLGSANEQSPNVTMSLTNVTLGGTINITGCAATYTKAQGSDNATLKFAGEAVTVKISQGATLTHDGFVYNAKDDKGATIKSSNGYENFYVYVGNVSISNASMVTDEAKHIGIALDNVDLTLKNGGILKKNNGVDGTTQNLSSLAVNGGTLDVESAATVSDTTTIADGATVVIKNADAKLGSVTGAGTVESQKSVTVNTIAADTSTQTTGFTGTLKATGNTTLTDAGSGSGFNVDATHGDIVLLNRATEVTLKSLVVGSGHSLTIGGSSVQPQTLAVGEANAAPAAGVRVTDTVTLEGGSSVVGGGLNLTETKTLTINNISNDSTITLNGALVLPTGGSITLAGGILDTLGGLAKGDTLNVFQGVTSLTLGSEVHTEALVASPEATDLINYFTIAAGLEAGSYSLGYTGAADGGVVYIQKDVPEPTTATLSLLALAALAARRRRKD